MWYRTSCKQYLKGCADWVAEQWFSQILTNIEQAFNLRTDAFPTLTVDIAHSSEAEIWIFSGPLNDLKNESDIFHVASSWLVEAIQWLVDFIGCLLAAVVDQLHVLTSSCTAAGPLDIWLLSGATSS